MGCIQEEDTSNLCDKGCEVARDVQWLCYNINTIISFRLPKKETVIIKTSAKLAEVFCLSSGKGLLIIWRHLHQRLDDDFLIHHLQ